MSETAYLNVFFGTELVGRVCDTEPLSFEYSEAWLADPQTMQISNIAKQPGSNSSRFVLAFFDNLLPEGALREYVARKHKVSTVYGLLAAVAGDSAGGMVLLPPGQQPGVSGYEPTTWAALARKLREGSGIQAADIKGDQARISLSGAQDKALIYIDAKGNPAIPKGTSPSTHILKPDIRRLEGVWHSAANEALVMRAASLCGLSAAEVFYEPMTQACIVKRFDRYDEGNGILARLVQYDLCQLDGIESSKKYETEGGPGVRRCAELIRRYSSTPAPDLELFLRSIFFNLCFGNNDGHAKNLAIMALRSREVRLAPLYDLTCTRIYPGLSQSFAFRIGGEDKPGRIGREHVEAMARELRMGTRFVLELAQDVASRALEAAKAANEQLLPAFEHSASELASRILTRVKELALGFQKRL